MATTDVPTMDGFVWSPAAPFVPEQEGENGWCMRDAVSRLIGWEPGSAEWSAFIENPAGWDIDRVAVHLGLPFFGFPEDWNDLIGRSAHPGVALFFFPAYQRSHAVYVNDVQWLLHHWPVPNAGPARPEERRLRSYGWPLHREYLMRGPELDGVIIDERQPPHGA